MRNFINLFEDRPTKTKTDFGLLPQLDKGAVATRPEGKLKVPGKRTRKPFKAIELDPEIGAEAATHSMNALRNPEFANLRDVVSDDEARRIAGIDDAADLDDVGIEPPGTDVVPFKPTTENLPAVINKEVAETNGKFFPEWRAIKHLPNYIQQPIRALGRQVFGQFTDTPIEDIMMIGTIGNLNPERDVVGMMHWIRKHGIRDDAANIDFSRIMPGYEADVSLWKTEDYSFLLVKDFAGYYIYGWAGGRGVHIEHKDHLRLTNEKDRSKRR